MNIELIERVAEWLESGAPPEKMHGCTFDMRDFIVSEELWRWDEVPENWCGTAACIGGCLIILGGGDVAKAGSTEAIRVSGLDYDAAENLFFPAIGESYADVSHDWAARTLRLMVRTWEETGKQKVDWDATRGR